MTKRYYSVDEANAAVPRLAETFGRIMQIRGQLKTLYKRLEAAGFAPDEEGFEVAVAGAPAEIVRDRGSFKGLVEMLRDEVAAVQKTGAVIKDIEVGLVDWFAQKDGHEIFLCWRYGESAVAFWHDLEGGFAGRRPVSELEPSQAAKQP